MKGAPNQMQLRTSLQSPNLAHRHATAARPPRGCVVGAARLRAGTAARLRVAAPYCALAAARGRLRGTLRQLTHVTNIEEKIAEYDRVLSRVAKTDHRSQQLMELKGVGPTTASALVASIGNAHDFKNGRQLAAWLGLTPSQYSSGGKSKLGRITKAGDAYLRTLLVQGARSVMVGAENRTDPFSRWVCSLIGRRGYWRAVVAIAAKNARLCWASLHYGDDFRLYSTT